MSGDVQARFCERLGVRFPGPTHLVMGFQYRADAERFQKDLAERLRKFGLELHPDKTRLIEFGRFAESNRKQRGEGKPETFNFLGFTHICGRTRKTGHFTVARKTVGKKMRAKLKEIKQQLCKRMHAPTAETGRWLGSVVQGYFNYHAIPGNAPRLQTFRDEVVRLWRHAMRRRGQGRAYTWEHMQNLVRRHIPSVRILHPYPSVRFAANHPR